MCHDSFVIIQANNNTAAGIRDRTKSTSAQDTPKTSGKKPPLKKADSMDLNPNPPLAGIKKRGNLRVTGQETEGECILSKSFVRLLLKTILSQIDSTL